MLAIGVLVENAYLFLPQLESLAQLIFRLVCSGQWRGWKLF